MILVNHTVRKSGNLSLMGAFLMNTKEEALVGHYSMVLRRIGEFWFMLLNKHKPFIKEFSIFPALPLFPENLEDGKAMSWGVPTLILNNGVAIKLSETDAFSLLTQNLKLMEMEKNDIEELKQELIQLLENTVSLIPEIPPLGKFAMIVVKPTGVRLNSGESEKLTHFTEVI